MKSTAVRVLSLSAGAVVLVAALPTFATAADKFTAVVVRNTAADPVITRATGTTEVAGQVGLAPGSSVGLAEGTAVGLAPGSRVGLEPGSRVGLEPGSAVGLAPGSEVAVANGAGGPLLVEDAAPRARWLNLDDFLSLPEADVTTVGDPFYTVPAGFSFVVTTATAATSPGVGAVEVSADCPTGGAGKLGGVFEGEDGFGFRTWHTTGEAGFEPGCQLRLVGIHQSDRQQDSVRIFLIGKLLPA